LREHIACWVTPYLLKVRESAPPFYAAWAELLLGVVGIEERATGAVAPRREAPEGASATDGDAALDLSRGMLPVHLRYAPPLDDGQLDSPRALVRALLTPVRSGIILTRADVHTCATSVGVGAIRMSERAMLLEDLLRAEPDGLVAWLISQAREWTARHEGWERRGGASAAFWRGRSDALKGVLQSARGQSR
jgi:hypothetical protein